MAKLSELTEEQLQQQLAKAAQRFKQATDNDEKLNIKKLHSAIKSEIQRRQDTIDVSPEQSEARLQAEWIEATSPEIAKTTGEQSEVQNEQLEEASTPEKSPAKKGLKKSGPAGKKKIGTKSASPSAKKPSPKATRVAPKDSDSEPGKKSRMPLMIGGGAGVAIIVGVALYFLVFSHPSEEAPSKVTTAPLKPKVESTESVATPPAEATPSVQSEAPSAPTSDSEPKETPKAEE